MCWVWAINKTDYTILEYLSILAFRHILSMNDKYVLEFWMKFIKFQCVILFTKKMKGHIVLHCLVREVEINDDSVILHPKQCDCLKLMEKWKIYTVSILTEWFNNTFLYFLVYTYQNRKCCKNYFGNVISFIAFLYLLLNCLVSRSMLRQCICLPCDFMSDLYLCDYIFDEDNFWIYFHACDISTYTVRW